MVLKRAIRCKSALHTSVAGANNIAIGEHALYAFANASGNSNIAIGNYSADSVNDNMVGNITIGSSTFVVANASGVDGNVIIGHYAGNGITTGNHNVGIGRGALYSSIAADQVIAIGYIQVFLL